MIRLDLRQPDGRVLRHMRLTKFPGSKHSRYFWTSRQTFYSLSPSMNLEIESRGFRKERFYGVTDHETIYMKEVIQITVNVTLNWPKDRECDNCYCFLQLKLENQRTPGIGNGRGKSPQS